VTSSAEARRAANEVSGGRAGN